MGSTPWTGFTTSPQQRATWLAVHTRATAVANPVAVVAISGPVDIDRLVSSGRRVIEDHESLRTRLVLPDGHMDPVQVVMDPVDVDPAALDLSAPFIGETDSSALAAAQVGQEIDPVGAAGAVRLRLLQTGPQQHLLVIAGAASVLDAASLLVVADEIASRYYDPSARAAVERIQYPDLAEWLNEWSARGLLLDRGADDGEGSGLPRLAAQLPSAGADPVAFALSGGAEVPLASIERLPRDAGHAVTRMRETTRSFECDERDLLLATWQAVLYRYTRNEATIGGLVCHGRDDPDLQAVVGSLARVLPIEVSVTEDLTLRTLVRHVRRSCAEAEFQQNRFDPAWWSVHQASTDRVVAAFDYLDLGRPRDANGMFFRCVAVHGVPAPAGLALSARRDWTGNLEFELVFDQRRFRQEDVRSLGDAFLSALTHVIGHPDVRVGELRLTSDHVVPPSGCRKAPDPAPELVPRRIAAQVRRTPGEIAVDGPGGALTYRELDQLAAGIAGRLIDAGVGPGAIVPVLLDRGAATIAAMLGTWRVGAAFTVLDELTPANRAGLILADISATAVVTTRRLAGLLPSGPFRLIKIDDASPAGGAAGPSTATAGGASQPGDLAYVVFTSGSTGTPKGVLVSHGALASYVRDITDRIGINWPATFAAMGTLAADLAYTAVFPTLSAGGRVSIVPPNATRDPVELAEWFAPRRIDYLKAVPSHLAALLASAPEPARILPGQVLLLGGEACPVRLVERVRELAPDCVVINHYGPTETTIGVCTYRADNAGPDLRTHTVPIGRPLPGCLTAVCDRFGHQVPSWVPGELYVSGAQLADGYLNRPSLTATHFIPRPGAPGRWYRTGDLARQLADGSLEFLGRIDHQVKVNGFRVEPQEIETVLSSQDQVRECAVIPSEDGGGLTAFVVTTPPPPSPKELRDHARRWLPAHMVPGTVKFVDALPRTGNGKIDRRLLSESEVAEASSTQLHVAAPFTDDIERRLLNIWRELLNTDRVSVHDDFYAAGGHSLLVMRLLTLIKRDLGVRVPVGTLLESATIPEMAAVIRVQSSRAPKPVVSLRSAGTRPALFCLHTAHGTVAEYLEFTRALTPDIPVYGIEAAEPEHAAAHVPLDHLAGRYAADISAAGHRDPFVLLGWSTGGVLAFEVCRSLRRLGRAVGLLVVIDGVAPRTKGADAGLGARQWDGEEDTDLTRRYAETYGSSLVMPEVYRDTMIATQQYYRDFSLDKVPDWPALLVRASAESQPAEQDATLGWRSLFGARLRLASVPAGHHDIMRSPAVGDLAAKVQAAYNAVLPATFS